MKYGKLRSWTEKRYFLPFPSFYAEFDYLNKPCQGKNPLKVILIIMIFRDFIWNFRNPIVRYSESDFTNDPYQGNSPSKSWLVSVVQNFRTNKKVFLVACPTFDWNFSIMIKMGIILKFDT